MNKKTPAHQDQLESLLDGLKRHQLKITPTRKLILESLLKNHGPFSAEDIQKRFIKKDHDLATIYRNLQSLEEAGILHRCEFGDGIARYELVDPDHDHHHHHLICRKCKKIEVVDACELEPTIHQFVKKHGFADVSHILEFFGVCPDCQG